MSFPLCIECKHYKHNKSGIGHVHQCLVQISLIDGKPRIDDCETSRIVEGLCGIGARKFEGKP